MKGLRCTVAGLFLTASGLCHSGGWPVFDVANLGQLLEQYSVETSQLTKEIQQYTQMLTEYQTMLENLKGFDPETLKKLFDVPKQVTEDFVLNRSIREIVNLDPNDPNFRRNVEVLYKQQYATPDPNWKTHWGGMFDHEDQDRIQAQFDDLGNDQETQRNFLQGMAKNNLTYTAWESQIDKYQKTGESLRANQQTEALQLQASELKLLLQQQIALLRKLDTMLIHQEEQDRKETEAQVKSKEYELKAVKRLKSQSYVEPPASAWLAK